MSVTIIVQAISQASRDACTTTMKQKHACYVGYYGSKTIKVSIYESENNYLLRGLCYFFIHLI